MMIINQHKNYLHISTVKNKCIIIVNNMFLILIFGVFLIKYHDLKKHFDEIIFEICNHR